MVKYFDEVLQEIGWSNGFNIPIANEENKALEAEFERLLARKNELTAKVSKLNERTANLKEHSAHIQKQESEAQFLITTSNNQLKDLTEQNVLLEKECEAIQRSTVKMHKEKKDLEERYNNLQKIVSKTVTQIDRLKKTVLVDSEALKMWENALKQSVDDNEIIKSYSKEDLQRIKDLELRRSKACEEVVERRKTVDKMVTEVTMLELVVEKTSAMYKQALAERKRLINQWSNTVKQLRQRDSDIIKAKEEIQVLREVIKTKKESLDDEKQFLKNQLKNNKETEQRIGELNKELNEKRQKKKDIIQRIHDYTNELDIQKREIEMISNDTVSERKWKKALLKEKEETINKLKKLKEEIEEIKVKIKDFDENAHLANSRVQNLQAIVEERQKSIKKLEQDILNIESANYRTQKSLNELIEEEKLYISDARNIEARIRTLEKEKDNLDTELLKSREITYNIEYKLTKMTSKIQKIEQERENKISKEDAERIKELQDELEEKNTQNEIIQAQLLSFNDEIRNMNIAIEKSSVELEKIRDKVLEKKLLIEGAEKQEKVVQLRCQQMQVEENLLKLQVAQVQKMLQHQRDELYSLEKTQVEFEAAVNERKLEIDLQKDMLLVQKRGLSEDIGKLKQESKERLIKLDQYKKRYDISLSLLGKDEDGEPLSVTHFKIKYAQEKYMMQQEGDELDEKIRKAEREILAMENTLKIMNVANEAYKKNLSSVDKNGPESKEMQELEEKHYNGVEKLKECRKKEKAKQKSIQELHTTIRELSEKLEQLGIEQKESEQDKNAIEKELRDQLEKINRADRTLTRLNRLVKSKDNIEHDVKEVEIQELQERNDSAVQQLAEIAARYVELEPTIRKNLQEYNITLPDPRTKLSPSQYGISAGSSPAISARSVTSKTSESSAASITQVVNLEFDSQHKTAKSGSDPKIKPKSRQKK